MPKAKKKALPHITPEILAVVNEVFEVDLVSDRGDLLAVDNQTSESMYLERRTPDKFYELTLKVGDCTYVNFTLPYLEGEDPEFFRGRLLSSYNKAICEQTRDLIHRIESLATHREGIFNRNIPEVDTQQENP